MVEEQLLLYHTGYSEIRVPDVHYGRKNADFGQGFYTTKNGEFAGRWAKERKDFKTVLNTYLLETKGLKIYELNVTRPGLTISSTTGSARKILWRIWI